METRRFGRSGHMSTVAIFGSYALSELDQTEADAVMEIVIGAGVNHIDVAPTYGSAEERLGPWMRSERNRFFLGCKTRKRAREDAGAQLRRSLETLRVDRVDLYQLHAVASMEKLDEVSRPGGALEALLEAREEGLTRFVGITSHGRQAPAVLLEALNRFPFDSVLFPINFVLYADPSYRSDADALLRKCRADDVGVMIIKSIARGPWGDREKRYHTWYRPFEDPGDIQKAVDFVLSKDVTGICTAGDREILPLVLDACERHAPMDEAGQEALLSEAGRHESIFP